MGTDFSSTKRDKVFCGVIVPFYVDQDGHKDSAKRAEILFPGTFWHFWPGNYFH